jgi:acyl dehydratase
MLTPPLEGAVSFETLRQRFNLHRRLTGQSQAALAVQSAIVIAHAVQRRDNRRMAILTKAIGARLRSFEADVSRRRVLAFSAAIGATFDHHFDDTNADALVAFPTLCTTFEHALLSNGFADGVNPTNASLEEMRRGVQTAQDTVFHRPIRPRQHVRANGRLVAIAPTRTGGSIRVEVEVVDARTQSLLTTSWISIVFRNTGTIGTPGEIAAPPPLPACPNDAQAVDVCTVPIAATFPHVYSECADIWNPIHTERRAAAAARLPAPIVHGSGIWSLALVRIVDACCDGDGTRVKRATASFRGMVFPGTAPMLRINRCGNWVSYAVEDAAKEITVDGAVEID